MKYSLNLPRITKLVFLVGLSTHLYAIDTHVMNIDGRRYVGTTFIYLQNNNPSSLEYLGSSYNYGMLNDSKRALPPQSIPATYNSPIGNPAAPILYQSLNLDFVPTGYAYYLRTARSGRREMSNAGRYDQFSMLCNGKKVYFQTELHNAWEGGAMKGTLKIPGGFESAVSKIDSNVSMGKNVWELASFVKDKASPTASEAASSEILSNAIEGRSGELAGAGNAIMAGGEAGGLAAGELGASTATTVGSEVAATGGEAAAISGVGATAGAAAGETGAAAGIAGSAAGGPIVIGVTAGIAGLAFGIAASVLTATDNYGAFRARVGQLTVHAAGKSRITQVITDSRLEQSIVLDNCLKVTLSDIDVPFPGAKRTAIVPSGDKKDAAVLLSLTHALPPGPYLQSCISAIKSDGITLQAYCNSASGGYSDISYLNLSSCQGTIINQSGRLACLNF